MKIRTVHVAHSLPDALARTAEGFLVLAGGTDVIPRMQQGLLNEAAFVAIRHLPQLAAVHTEGESLHIGAAITLGDLARSHLCPGWLGRACVEVASPRVRELATLGGALLQQGRCRFLNRPWHWRLSAGLCLRLGGSRCHAGGDRCWAQQRSLLATLLVAAGASVDRACPTGVDTVDLLSLYPTDAAPCRPDGVITSIRIPRIPDDAVAVETVRRRASIDFHDLIVAGVRGESALDLTVAIGGALPYPQRFTVKREGDGGSARIAEDAIPSVQTGRFNAPYLRQAAAVLLRRVRVRLLS